MTPEEGVVPVIYDEESGLRARLRSREERRAFRNQINAEGANYINRVRAEATKAVEEHLKHGHHGHGDHGKKESHAH